MAAAARSVSSSLSWRLDLVVRGASHRRRGKRIREEPRKPFGDAGLRQGQPFAAVILSWQEREVHVGATLRVVVTQCRREVMERILVSYEERDGGLGILETRRLRRWNAPSMEENAREERLERLGSITDIGGASRPAHEGTRTRVEGRTTECLHLRDHLHHVRRLAVPAPKASRASKRRRTCDGKQGHALGSCGLPGAQKATRVVPVTMKQNEKLTCIPHVLLGSSDIATIGELLPRLFRMQVAWPKEQRSTPRDRRNANANATLTNRRSYLAQRRRTNASAQRHVARSEETGSASRVLPALVQPLDSPGVAGVVFE